MILPLYIQDSELSSMCFEIEWLDILLMLEIL